MTTTYTSNKGYALQGTGDNTNTWGATLNTGVFTIVDKNLGGRYSVDASGSSDVTVSTTNAQNIYQDIYGTLTGNINYVLPSLGGFYVVNNRTSGAFSVTVKPTGGTGVVVPQGASLTIFVNPDTNVAAAASSAGIFSSLSVSGNAAITGTSTSASIAITGTGTSSSAGSFALAGAASIGGNISVTSTSGTSTFIPLVALNGGATTVTQTSTDSSTKVATTAFVQTVLGTGANIKSINTRVLTATGTATYTRPANLAYADVFVNGGGGGGGSPTSQLGAGGGGAGGYSKKTLSAATIGATQTYVIGTGGASATAGGTTSFGAIISATGGSAGSSSGSAGLISLGGSGGTGTGGDVNQSGSPGSLGFLGQNAGAAWSGNGGSSIIAGGALGSAAAADTVGTSAASNSGAGGAGGISWSGAMVAGGSGGSGVIIITEYLT